MIVASCETNDFHYDSSQHAIVSNHSSLKDLSVNIEDLHHKYLGGCDLGKRRTNFVDIRTLASLASESDSNYSKFIYKPNTILTIRNSGGDAGPFTIKLLIDSNKNIKQIQ